MDALILIDKPSGITSSEVVRRIKRLVKPSRVGHLGTLDPFATGVLPIMIGEATKLAPMLEGGDKEYEGMIRLGVETDTLDRDGEPVREAPIPEITPDALDSVAAQFTGKIEQVPPVYSAIKRGGERMYALARKGVEVEPPQARTVGIKSLSIEAADSATLKFRARCTPGTYARSLARDIAIALGTAGHLCELRRTANGNFRIESAISLEMALKELEAGGAIRSAIGLREALEGIPEVAVDEPTEIRLRNGDSRALDATVPAGCELFKVIRDGRLVAIAKPISRMTAALVRVFNTRDDEGTTD